MGSANGPAWPEPYGATRETVSTNAQKLAPFGGSAAPRQGAFDYESRKTPISKPAANAQRPKVQAETMRTRLRRSSCEISWDQSAIAAAPLRWPLGFGENAKTTTFPRVSAQKKAIEGRSKLRYR